MVKSLDGLLRRWRRGKSPRTLSSLDAYAQWAARYPPHAHNALMATEETAMLSLLPPLSGLDVLDLACGTGRYALLAQAGGARLVVGLDNSAVMLRANPAGRLALATSEAIPLADACMDGVLCGLALGHLPGLSASLNEISRVLRPDGWALVSDFHPFIFLHGARRTFSASDGTTYAVEHYAHLYSDYHDGAAQAGLRIEQVVEPRLQGMQTGAPVIIAFRLRKKA